MLCWWSFPIKGGNDTARTMWAVIAWSLSGVLLFYTVMAIGVSILIWTKVNPPPE